MMHEQDVVILKNCGHWTPTEGADEVNKRLQAFLAQRFDDQVRD